MSCYRLWTCFIDIYGLLSGSLQSKFLPGSYIHRGQLARVTDTPRTTTAIARTYEHQRNTTRKPAGLEMLSLKVFVSDEFSDQKQHVFTSYVVKTASFRRPDVKPGGVTMRECWFNSWVDFERLLKTTQTWTTKFDVDVKRQIDERSGFEALFDDSLENSPQWKRRKPPPSTFTPVVTRAETLFLDRALLNYSNHWQKYVADVFNGNA